MIKADDPVSTLSPKNTDPTPRSGWLRKVPLPIKTGNAAQPRSKEPHNALAHAWQTCRAKHYPLQYHKHIGFQEGCMLAEFGHNLGDQAPQVIEFAIGNWKTFVSKAERQYGLFGPQPR